MTTTKPTDAKPTQHFYRLVREGRPRDEAMQVVLLAYLDEQHAAAQLDITRLPKRVPQFAMIGPDRGEHAAGQGPRQVFEHPTQNGWSILAPVGAPKHCQHMLLRCEPCNFGPCWGGECRNKDCRLSMAECRVSRVEGAAEAKPISRERAKCEALGHHFVMGICSYCGLDNTRPVAEPSRTNTIGMGDERFARGTLSSATPDRYGYGNPNERPDEKALPVPAPVAEPPSPVAGEPSDWLDGLLDALSDGLTLEEDGLLLGEDAGLLIEAAFKSKLASVEAELQQQRDADGIWQSQMEIKIEKERREHAEFVGSISAALANGSFNKVELIERVEGLGAALAEANTEIQALRSDERAAVLKSRVYGEQAYKWRQRCVDAGLAAEEDRILADEWQARDVALAEANARAERLEGAIRHMADEELSNSTLRVELLAILAAPSQPLQDAQPVEAAVPSQSPKLASEPVEQQRAIPGTMWFYAESSDAESWQGPHDSLADALEAARSDYTGSLDSFWIDEAHPVDWDRVLRGFVDADDMLERFGEYAGDNERIEDPEPEFKTSKVAAQDALEVWAVTHLSMRDYWQCVGKAVVYPVSPPATTEPVTGEKP